ncbi:M20/M25/M40 family metallo-hydrolase [Phenylobacterium sp.]|uniref:M20/M25/M40 family metallo-hydrolase n=1 Tax=Phenylobacterium sp. TaxID=1871053 RepID=UPI002811284E|nr:M20/M25/M40 family metallo-hydrolase [Phenylobacterium sp.]
MTCRASLFAAAAALLCLAASPAQESQALRDVRVLSADDMQGRAVGAPGSAKARTYLLERMRQVGLRPVGGAFEHPFRIESRGRAVAGVNLLGLIPGTSDTERVMVLSAHYDHLGVRGGQTYNGADDNASGVAAVLAIAEAFRERPPEHTVLVALWDGEEAGLAGAKAFVTAPPIPMSRIALNMNLDMVGRGDKGELYVAGARHYPMLKPHLDAVAAEADVALKQGHDGPPWKGSDDWTFGSDHGAFHAAGVPFAYFGVEDHPDYHGPGDDFHKLPKDFYLRSVATLVKAARRFDANLGGIARAARRG